MTVVFDSFALLNFFREEEGSDTVYNYLKRVQRGEALGYICAVNLGEIYYITWREKNEEGAETTLRSIKEWGIKIILVDEQLAKRAGRLKAEHPLSLADAFAAAATDKVNGMLLTGDPEFKCVKNLIDIQWLKKAE